MNGLLQARHYFAGGRRRPIVHARARCSGLPTRRCRCPGPYFEESRQRSRLPKPPRSERPPDRPGTFPARPLRSSNPVRLPAVSQELRAKLICPASPFRFHSFGFVLHYHPARRIGQDKTNQDEKTNRTVQDELLSEPL